MGSVEPEGDTTSPPGLPESTAAPALHPDRVQGRVYLGLVGLAALIGIPAALVASVFLVLVHWVEDMLWTGLPEALGKSEPPWYLVVAFPVAGAALVALARLLLPGDGGHSPLHGIGGGATPWQYAPGIALAAVGTLAFGAVLGPEAPLIALGSAVGMVVVPFARAGRASEQVLATAGSFSAISALFGGPLVAGILLLEAGLATGAALLPALLPGLAAAAVGYVVFVGLGDWGGLGTSSLSVPELPDYDGTRIADLLLAIVVGVLAGLAISRVQASAHAIDRAARSSGTRRSVLFLLGGGLVVGLAAQTVEWLGADSQEVLFSGQSAIPELLAETSIGVFVAVIAAKSVGYAVSLGCGFRGGPVFPAIFIGVAIATIACVLFDSSPTWALAVGAGAGMTAGTGMVFSSLLFSMLLCGSAGQDALPAAVLAVIAAWLTNAALRQRSEDAPAPPQPA